MTAEDERDSTAQALADGPRHRDPLIRLLAARAIDRTRDPKFTARDSFPAPAPPPAYPDPAWRTRYRELARQPVPCDRVYDGLRDREIHVQLRAIDVLSAACVRDADIRELRDYADALPRTGVWHRGRRGGWQISAHALLALARLSPGQAPPRLARFLSSSIPWARVYAARAARVLNDTAALRRLARDANDNVREAAIDGLSDVAKHDADDEYLRALSASGYQVVRAAARALHGSPRGGEVFAASLAAARRLRQDSSETSRDARMALIERLSEFISTRQPDVADLATDFDCDVARAAAKIASVEPNCHPLPRTLPHEATRLALGEQVLVRVTLADTTGGGWFTVRLRGDVAPIMAARVLDLVRAGWYNGRTWYRVEPDFVIQGGGPGSNEYVGHPRFMRDELSTLPHVRGTVGMSTRGHDTGDAQWFINLRDNQRLTRDYTAFGEVVEGIDVVDAVREGTVIDRIEVIKVSASPR